MWEWLKDEGNLRALKIVGAVISSLAAASWTIITFWLPISDSQRMEDALGMLRSAASGMKVHKLAPNGDACELRFLSTGGGATVVVDVRKSDLFHSVDSPTIWIFSNPRQEIEVTGDLSQDAAKAYTELKELCSK